MLRVCFLIWNEVWEVCLGLVLGCVGREGKESRRGNEGRGLGKRWLMRWRLVEPGEPHGRGRQVMSHESSQRLGEWEAAKVTASRHSTLEGS